MRIRHCCVLPCAPQRLLLLFSLPILLLTALLALTTPSLRSATPITVTNPADSGPGSLRQAVADAAPGATIVFDASLSGATIMLSETLAIDKALTIDGSGLATPITLRGSNALRVITVRSGAHTTLSSLVIANELSNPDPYNAFSGILNSGTLFLQRITIRGLRVHAFTPPYLAGGSAIYNEGVLVVTQSTFAENHFYSSEQFIPGYGSSSGGGAIYNKGVMTVTHSTFTDNAADRRLDTQPSLPATRHVGGGAILNLNQATIVNSTFAGNRSNRNGGAVLHQGDGVLTIHNSTITGNYAEQGGGLYAEGELQLSNTIIADSTGGDDCWRTGALATNSHNLIESGNCAAMLTADPNVGPLADHGGAIQTRMLLAGSPALDAGDSARCPPVDQRGVARLLDGGCDIGAVEGVATTIAPEIEVTGNGVSLAHGDTTPVVRDSTGFGAFDTLGAQATHRFTIVNRGTTALANLAVQLAPPDSGFAVAVPPAAVLAPGQSSPFDILFTAQTLGVVTATVEISSNDSDEAPYRFTVQGFPCGRTLSVTSSAALGPGSLPATLAQSCIGGVVSFAPELSGATITLSNTLEIDRDVTLDGTALATPVTVRVDSRQRVLHIAAATNATLTGFTVADGYLFMPLPGPATANGAGLLNEGRALVDRVTFHNNQTHGSRAYVEGGAISNHGVLTVTNSTFSANSASGGGAIVNHGQLVLRNSTLRDNYAQMDGGGQGGAIYNTALLTVTNSTFHANQARSGYGAGRGGGIFNQGTAWITNSTFSENAVTPTYYGSGTGGAIAGGGVLHLVNTIMANGINSIDNNDCDALPTTNINNLIEDGSCAPLFAGDPLLGPLADNGGATLTHALLPGSLAINTAAAAACPATDQRGVARPQHIGCDIGAFESETADGQPAWTVQGNGRSVPNGSTAPMAHNGTEFALVTLAQGQRTQTFRIGNSGTVALTDLQVTLAGARVREFAVTISPPPTIGPGALADFAVTFAPTALGRHTATVVISSTAGLPAPYTFAVAGNGCVDAITVQTTADRGSGSLRQALLDLCPGGVVTFAELLSGQTIGLSSALLITKPLTIDGSSLAAAPMLDGNNATQLLTIQGPIRVILRNLTFTRGELADYQRGGALYNEGYLTVHTGAFLHNGANNGSGAIVNRGNLTVTQSTFVDNRTGHSGGAIRHQAGVLLIDRSAFTANITAGDGGAIYSYAPMTVTNSTFRDNTASSAGGAIASFYTANHVTLRNNALVGNHAATLGGGLYSEATMTLQNSTLSANTAAGGGGGLYIKGPLTLHNSTINANQGSGFVNKGAAQVTNTIIANSIDGADCSGPLSTSSNNLIADGSCGAVLTGNPLLEPLADNGGPTLTHALGFGSLAVDGGDNAACLATDQRGVARPIDGNSDDAAICDIGAFEAPKGPYIVVTPPPTATATPSPTSTSMGTSTSTPTTTPTPSVTPTLGPAPTFTPVPHFAVELHFALSANPIHVGETITVAVTVANQSMGCDFPVYELTLTQVGEPRFRVESPATVGPPVGARTVYTLTALTTGSVVLQASAYGERHCDDAWQWTYVNGSFGPLVVGEPLPATVTPTVIPTATLTPTATQMPTQMPTATPTLIATAPPSSTPMPGDGNGDQVVDRTDLDVCVREIFDDDGVFWQDAPGCDANGDTMIDAGDASCIGRLLFGASGCDDVVQTAAGMEGATLTLLTAPTVFADTVLPVALRLTTAGAPVTAAALRLRYDAAHFSLDTADRNGDSLPDALVFALPALATAPVITVTAHSGVLDIFLTDLAATPAIWGDGGLLTVMLHTNPLVDTVPVTTTLAFDGVLPPSLGSATGRSVPVRANDATVTIVAPLEQHYLPLIQR